MRFVFTAFYAAGGQLFTWGRGALGRLAVGSGEDISTATFVGSLAHLAPFAAIACGADHSMALSKAAGLYVWGKLGTSTVVVPRHVSGFGGEVADMAAGAGFAAASNGSSFCVCFRLALDLTIGCVMR